ncbi:hypothetical protein HD554DRAFT_2046734 [Boletus coccyginus]|nr:hypothetical protein HD554DRAFT_2046734 [Boletus coccyginus]
MDLCDEKKLRNITVQLLPCLRVVYSNRIANSNRPGTDPSTQYENPLRSQRNSTRMYPPHTLPHLTSSAIQLSTRRVSTSFACLFLPPDDEPHNPSDYALYYDPIYFPLEHASCFDTPENFCSWLKNTLRTHSVSCIQCTVEFIGSVSFDGCSIIIFFVSARRSLVKTLAYFADANYTHCHRLQDFVDEPHSPSDMPQAPLLDRRQDLPPWFFYADSVYEVNLSFLLANVLAKSLSPLHIAKGNTKRKSHRSGITFSSQLCISCASTI